MRTPRIRSITATVGALCVFLMLSQSAGLGKTLNPLATESDDCEAQELVKLMAGDVDAGDHLGNAVDVGDGRIIVGALLHDDNGNNSGAAYVFRYLGASWIEEAELLPKDGVNEDRFGESVGISGDAAIVGANGDDDNGPESGSAYIFRFDGRVWIQEAKLVPSDGSQADEFGKAVAISGDLAIVGAYRADEAGVDSGAAYIFRRTESAWEQEIKLLASDGETQDRFGWSVALSGNVALIGARRHDDNGVESGAAYVFRFNGSTWIEEQKLLASDGDMLDDFGFSVSLSENVAVIGARGDEDNGFESGSAYVFRFMDSMWTEEQKLLAKDGEPEDKFGHSVAVSGDVAVIGARWDDDNGTDSGSAYVFSFNGDGWSQEAKLAASDGAAGDAFGVYVGVHNGIAGVGAPEEDDPGGNSGALYVFGGLSDCNENGELDICDIADGTSEDDNGNGIPDECEIKDLVLDLDIKPGSCPNPLNRNSHGMMPAAILGTDVFDAAQIDISSVLISRADGTGGSVAPNEGPPGPHSVLEDVGTPFDGESCDCHELQGDGVVDLLMHFQTQEVVEALELDDLPPGTFVELTVTGVLLDKTPFAANDCIRLVPPGDMDGDGVVGAMDLIMLISSWGSCAECIDCPVDLDGDCAVGAADLLILLANWR